jgi:hypothetical protein
VGPRHNYTVAAIIIARSCTKFANNLLANCDNRKTSHCRLRGIYILKYLENLNSGKKLDQDGIFCLNLSLMLGLGKN